MGPNPRASENEGYGVGLGGVESQCNEGISWHGE